MSIETVHDPEFGLLTWESELNEWTGHCIMGDGTEFIFSVATLGYDYPPAQIASNSTKIVTEKSRSAFRNIRCSDAHVRSRIAEDYLSHYPEWNGGERIKSEEFQRRLQLDGIRVLPSGEAEVYYRDGGMFYGHWLIAHLNANGIVDDVDLFS